MKSLIKQWRPATVVTTQRAADDIMSIELEPETWVPHLAGQHYELRLPGNYLSRKYSIVSSPLREGRLEFGVQLLPYGEVSPQLWKLKAGDKIEIRGPLGAFVWRPDMTGPLILIAGGSGITPFLSMYDHFKHVLPAGQIALIVSTKDSGRVMHYNERKQDILTRFTASEGRIDKQFLQDTVGKFASDPNAYCLTCGPGGFTGYIINTLIELGFPESRIRRETFN